MGHIATFWNLALGFDSTNYIKQPNWLIPVISRYIQPKVLSTFKKLRLYSIVLSIPVCPKVWITTHHWEANQGPSPLWEVSQVLGVPTALQAPRVILMYLGEPGVLCQGSPGTLKWTCVPTGPQSLQLCQDTLPSHSPCSYLQHSQLPSRTLGTKALHTP